MSLHATVVVLLSLMAFTCRAASLEGLWSGTLEAGVKLRLVLKVNADAQGNLRATLQSVDQGVTLPVSSIVLEAKKLTFEVEQIGGSFEGTLNAASTQATGVWRQVGAELPLTLNKTLKAPQPVRPQEPKPPFPYEAIEVSYRNQGASVKLAGTLTVPRAVGPFPAVLLLTGSGPQDRNETIMGHKPFLLIADYLTRRGVAVLRVDDRGVGGSTGDNGKSTIEDFVGDAVAGVEFLKHRKEIDPSRIGLLGHREGAIVASLAARRLDSLAFVVLLAGPGVTGEQLLYAQGAAISRTLGAGPLTIAKQNALQHKLFDIVKQGGDPVELRARLEKEIDKSGEEPGDAQQSEAMKRIAASQLDMILAPGFRFFLTHDPAAVLKSVKCPVLALYGQKDTQVPCWQNLPPVVAALEAGANPGYRAEKFAGLNHLFQTAPTGSVIEYAQIEETMAPVVLDALGGWITRVTRKH